MVLYCSHQVLYCTIVIRNCNVLSVPVQTWGGGQGLECHCVSCLGTGWGHCGLWPPGTLLYIVHYIVSGLYIHCTLYCIMVYNFHCTLTKPCPVPRWVPPSDLVEHSSQTLSWRMALVCWTACLLMIYLVLYRVSTSTSSPTSTSS